MPRKWCQSLIRTIWNPDIDDSVKEQIECQSLIRTIWNACAAVLMASIYSVSILNKNNMELFISVPMTNITEVCQSLIRTIWNEGCDNSGWDKKSCQSLIRTIWNTMVNFVKNGKER